MLMEKSGHFFLVKKKIVKSEICSCGGQQRKCGKDIITGLPVANQS